MLSPPLTLLALIGMFMLIGLIRISHDPVTWVRGARNSIVAGARMRGAPGDQILRLLSMILRKSRFAPLFWIAIPIAIGMDVLYAGVRPFLVALTAVWNAPVAVPRLLSFVARYLHMVQRVADGHHAYASVYGPKESTSRVGRDVEIQNVRWYLTLDAGQCVRCESYARPMWTDADSKAQMCPACVCRLARKEDQNDRLSNHD